MKCLWHEGMKTLSLMKSDCVALRIVFWHIYFRRKYFIRRSRLHKRSDFIQIIRNLPNNLRFSLCFGALYAVRLVSGYGFICVRQLPFFCRRWLVCYREKASPVWRTADDSAACYLMFFRFSARKAAGKHNVFLI